MATPFNHGGLVSLTLATAVLVSAVCHAETPPPMIKPTYQDTAYGVVCRMDAVGLGTGGMNGAVGECLNLPAGDWRYYSDGAGTIRHDRTMVTSRVDGAPVGLGDPPANERVSQTLINGQVLSRTFTLTDAWRPDPGVSLSQDTARMFSGVHADSSFPMCTYGVIRTDGVRGFWLLSDLQSMAASTTVEESGRVKLVHYAMPDGKLRVTIGVDQNGIIRNFTSTYTEDADLVIEKRNEFTRVELVDGFQFPTQIRQIFRINGVPTYTVTGLVQEYGVGARAAQVVPPIEPESAEIVEFNEAVGSPVVRPGKTVEEYRQAGG